MYRPRSPDFEVTDIILNGTGFLQLWKYPFNAPTIIAQDLNFWLQSKCPISSRGCYLETIHFNGTSVLQTLPNRWELVQSQFGQKNISASFIGGSGGNFPQVSAEMQAIVQVGSPGSILRSIQQGLYGLTPEDPTCAATAAQDLVFDLADRPLVKAVFSTWDSSQWQVCASVSGVRMMLCLLSIYKFS